eukprot:jgi/Antlo1/433/1763
MNSPALSRKCTKDERPLKLTLSDCLACSGCITSEEERLLEQSDYKRLIEDDSEQHFMISPYSKVRIYSAMFEKQDLSYQDFEKSLAEFLKVSCNAIEVIDTSYYQWAVLEMVADEFFGSSVPIITSDCPGTVAYIERSGQHLLGNLCRVLTPQQLCAGTLRKRGRITSIVPCYDKKMENKRDGCEIDYILSTDEFIDFLAHKQFRAAKCNKDLVSREKALVPYKSFSGGYTEYILKKMECENVVAEQVSKGHWVYRCKVDEKTHTLHKIYGIKNVLNMITRTKKKVDFDFAEVFLCEDACARGPAGTDTVSAEIKRLYSMFESCTLENIPRYVSIKRKFKPATTKKTNFLVDW